MKSLVLSILLVLALGFSAYAQTSSATISLRWTDNSNNESKFFVYRDGVKIGEVGTNTTTYADTVTGAWKQQFCYQVSAVNNQFVDGTGALQESAKSNQSCAAIPVPQQSPPNAPSDVIASDPTKVSMRLRWSDVEGEETYQVSRGDRIVGEIPADSVEFVDTGLRRNTRYTWRVRARNEAGESAWSGPVRARTTR